MNIPLMDPDIREEDIQRVADVLRGKYLTRGKNVQDFEGMFRQYLGVPYALAVNNGTSALHLAVMAAGLKEKDEVITTPFTFIATTNALLMERVKPVFVDINPSDFNINADLIEEKITRNTKAILSVDAFGRPADSDRINSIARKHNLLVIEDSCEALGSEYKGRKVGSLSDISTFSFFPNKQITTGEGGMVTTSREDLYDLCINLRNHGVEEHPNKVYTRLGYNYWMNEMSASLGISQMERLEELTLKRKSIVSDYFSEFDGIDGITLPEKASDVNWFLLPTRVKNKAELVSYLKSNNIPFGNYFPPIHLQPAYAFLGHKTGDFPETEKAFDELVCFPINYSLKRDQIKYISDKLKEFYANVAHR